MGVVVTYSSNVDPNHSERARNTSRGRLVSIDLHRKGVKVIWLTATLRVLLV